MQQDRYIYPPYEIPLLDAWNRRFESVFILLHPFVRMPESLAWRAIREYPADHQILAQGARCRWSEVTAQTGLPTYAKINQALLTSSAAIADYLCDHMARDALHAFVQSDSVWMPSAGRFEPLLHEDFLAAFDLAGHDDVIFVPEFPQLEPMQRLAVAGLRNRSITFPSRGSLVAPDESFVFTVDWDSFFTLFYGSCDFVEQVVGARSLEGFYATPTTEHAWFNYTFGCATVTVGP